MNPFKFPFALVGFLAFVMVLPPWMWFLNNYPSVSQLSTEARFLANLILPALLALFVAGWVQPRS